ncbi:uncharacterized protein LOC135392416 [Ornithodoros turicata]|uniref:uncharacterized protein LOC135392416 n=1 Tax=Ornithodoros turicata TaxID=34597 RepID=UPI00313A457E
MYFMACTSVEFPDGSFAGLRTSCEAVPYKYTRKMEAVTITTSPAVYLKGVYLVLYYSMLFVVMALLPQQLPKGVHIGMYADDICLWSSGVQLPALQRRLQAALDCTHTFLTERGMDISPEKTVYLNFTRKKMTNFQLKLTDQPIQRLPHHRFLGVVIDRQLSWAADVKCLKDRVVARTNILRHFAGPSWGMSTSSLLTAHKALIRQVMAYHLPVLHGISEASEKTLQSVLTRSLKVCLDVPVASSNTLSTAEAREPPVDVLRTQETLRHYIRLRTQHDRHPPVRKVHRRNSSFSEAVSPYCKTLPKRPSPCTILHPPWSLGCPRIYTTVPGVHHQKSNLPPSALEQYCLSMLENNQPRIAMFTDGATTKSGSAAAYVVPQHSKEGIVRLSHRTSSTTAELVAIHLAVRYIATHARPAHWIVYSDSKAGLEPMLAFLGKSWTASTVNEILTEYKRCTDLGHDVIFQWIPGNIGIRGNETADELAGIAHLASTKRVVMYTGSDIKLLLRSMTDDMCKRKWLQGDGGSSLLRRIDPELKFSIPPSTAGSIATCLHRARLNVPYGRHFLHMVGKADSPDCPVCGMEENTEDIFTECRRHQSQRKTLGPH